MKEYKKLLFALLAKPGDISKNGQIVSLTLAGEASLAVLGMAVILWMTIFSSICATISVCLVDKLLGIVNW